MVSECPTLWNKDKKVTETEKKLSSVREGVDKCLETKVFEDDLEARDEDDLRKGSDEDHDCVPQSDVDDVRHNSPELESDRPKNTRKIGAPDRMDTKKSDVSATKKAGEKITSRVDHGIRSDQSTSQLPLFDDAVLSQLQPE